MLIWVILGCLIILNLIYNAVFCAVYERIDKKRFLRETQACVINANSQQNNNDSNTSADAKKSSGGGIKHYIFEFLAHYGYGWMRLSFLLVGRFPSNRIRNLIYRFIFRMKITSKTIINGGVEVRSPWNVHADRCVIMTGCILDGRHGLDIGEDVVFGTGVHIWTEEHDLNDPYFGVHGNHAKKVTIGDHAWICSDSRVLPGVSIGEGAVIASSACVVKDCEPFGVYGGVPAKKISDRNHDMRYVLSGKPHWHFY